ncbi:poly-beta-1,6-N-acetyl-D-glucosamine N-deacetylase PgaB [Erwinia sp. Leaf53]|uniref:poly-beta-1,6-N-acetyl-D-glucosamine N-deacetylase PgaB n=1 Tax=Erwinia sp. Leaf53 TaxID=1736225 RepID=UPI0006FBF61F|nr:poly-beta-1,6-N-acetyl-D-glucosamine N-deacetylase PgaB [Erwinia sp. Leaf53]KQN57792.1 poly-beta-1,6-N-acetyl-D-glucosamine N-deacetylase PgaB [Erwinia sp. Leaf53]
MRLFTLLSLALAALLTSACSQTGPLRFTPPAQRAVLAAEKPWPKNHFIVLAYHDVEDGGADQRYLSVRSDALNEQFAWLRENGYRPVSVDQILAARDGGAPLPEKAVLLSFDDGYSSFYRRVWPLLQAYQWHAVLAPVGSWVSTPVGQPVNFGGLITPRDRFATWQQIAEMSRSGLVEIGAHTWDQHKGAVSNPQGNSEPFAVNRSYSREQGAYESGDAYRQRVREDVTKITQKITEVTGKAPRVWVWPYGAAGGEALSIVRQQGYQMALTLNEGLASVDRLDNVPRLLIGNNPGLYSFSQRIAEVQEKAPMRVLHVDLDYVYDADPQQQSRNLDKLIQRVADTGASTVFLQAFADPDGDGNVKQLYFPNRWLPVRADLFNRVAWQISTRTHASVYAWMPVLAFDLDKSLPRVAKVDLKTGQTTVDAQQYQRLSPYSAEARRRIREIYQDLAAHTSFSGIIFHDDALLGDDEDASPDALQAYQAAGFPTSIAAIRQDPAMMQRWTRFKSRTLIDFTRQLAADVRAIRGPQVKTARNIFALPILEPESEAWFAQNLDDFLQTYDWVAPMAMPLMEQVPQGQDLAWLDKLVTTVALRPGALQKTVFELQSRDWRQPEEQGALSGEQLADWMKQLQTSGAQSFGYYPDDFLNNRPALNDIRPVFSSTWYPLP